MKRKKHSSSTTSETEPTISSLVKTGEVPFQINGIQPPEYQKHFLLQAKLFPAGIFQKAVDNFAKLSEPRKESFVQVLRDVEDAFEGWASWAGSLAPDEREEFREEVTRAKTRVLSYLHGFRVIQVIEEINDGQA